jgi:N utilization substance protein A
MLDVRQFTSAIKQIAEEKGIPENKVVETIESAIAAAYKKEYGEKGQVIRAKLNLETGEVAIYRVRFVVEGVDEEGNILGKLPNLSGAEAEGDRSSRREISLEEKDHGQEVKEVRLKFNPEKYITLEEAKRIDKKLGVGDELVIELEPKTDFGRIAAQTAKQVIIQRLREIEREAIFAEFKKKEGEAVSGIVQRIEGRIVYVDLGHTNGLLAPAEQLYQDNYKVGQRLRFLVLKVEETSKGPVILLSRSHPKLVLKLFEFEVPEIEAGSVEIKAVAREAGSRSKVAVTSNEEGVDPIGSLVGQRGVRVQTVINELNGEKIDIIEWSENPEKFIANALSPAKIIGVKIIDRERRQALVEVSDDQFSLAIGKKGQNVRLAAKLTGWRIDVRAPQAQMSAEEAFAPSEITEGDEKPESVQEFRQDYLTRVEEGELDISKEGKETNRIDKKSIEEINKTDSEEKNNNDLRD